MWNDSLGLKAAGLKLNQSTLFLVTPPSAKGTTATVEVSAAGM